MAERLWRRRLLGESLRLLAFGLPVALLVSLSVLYGLSWISGLEPSSRELVLAASLPLMIATPLLVWLAQESLHLSEVRRAFDQTLSRDPELSFLRGPLLAELVDRRRNSTSAESASGAFLLVDTSRLNDINRRYGFEWHDEALRHVAVSIRGAVRSADLIGRLGADAFGVFLGGARAEDAFDVGQRIRAAVSARYFAPDGVQSMIDVTVVGVTFEDDITFSELYAQALDMLGDPTARHSTALTIARKGAAVPAGSGV